ncbi:ADP-ribose pyrophosphatase [Weissella uvarum]|uniref:NUDIX hydrolase n=1 Tax=Weissella uvarum TaxID=1479233 RepID=UPI001961D4BB|nr:NUDIX hydrolase [Weissella uvarum]MBM7617830.1 ADP-ribose pyrophosphatase [Weissella uvarum]MCM0595791.1 NUDIX hydrolase [Weissella uvarum]
MDENYRETVLQEDERYAGHIIRVTEQVVALPDGRKAHRDIVYHSGAIAILALTDDGKMILEEQWRAPVQAKTLEIPAGKVDNRDDNYLDTVQRELNEETRLSADHIEKIAGFYTSIGFSDEYMELYLATGLHPVEHALPQDDDESIDLKYYTLDEMNQLFSAGKLNDAKTLMAYFYWQTLQGK